MYNYHEMKNEELEFVTVCTVDELGEGERLIVDVGGEAIIVLKLAGEYFAIGDVCSHDDGPLGEGEVDGHQIECPRHGARFNLSTGEALTLPAVVDIPAYPVRVEGEEIQVGLPPE